jgi:SAM-dependent methyltransferase
MSAVRGPKDEFTRLIERAIGFNPDSDSHRKFLADAVQWVGDGGSVDRLFPILDEWKEAAGTASGQYFLQDLQVAQWVFAANPERHVDIGSRVDGFVAHVASFRAIEVLDIRPLTHSVTNIRFVQSDFMNPGPQFSEYADSVSCLHALEHFGLGRYGDPIDPAGHLKGFASLVRMVKPGGTLYLSVPIGRRRIEFNAHRIFGPEDVLAWPDAAQLELTRFCYVGDDERLHEDATPSALAKGTLSSGLGIYVFRKRVAPHRSDPVIRNRRPALRKAHAARAVVTYPALGSNGRLGNQLFQIAATIGIARRNACDALFPPWSYAPVFAGPVPQWASAAPTAGSYREPAFSYRDVEVKQPTELIGYFQSEKYFAHCEQEIRHILAPGAGVAASVTRLFTPFADRRTVSVHVRRTDYLGLDVLANLGSTDYYRRAIGMCHPDTVFLFFSDDIPWCQENFSDPRFVFIQGFGEVIDLFLMSRCNAHIIANSSFSWWGAWLDARPDKQVIAPARWFAGSVADASLPFRSGPPHSGFHDASDLIPGGWTKI